MLLLLKVKLLKIEIDKPILTTKDRGMAKSKIDMKKENQLKVQFIHFS